MRLALRSLLMIPLTAGCGGNGQKTSDEPPSFEPQDTGVEVETDADGDGVTVEGGDCDDTDPEQGLCWVSIDAGASHT